MGETITAYKALRTRMSGGKEELVSAFAKGDYRLQYEVGKVTRPKDRKTKLFVFHNKGSAEAFALLTPSLRIYEVECGEGLEQVRFVAPIRPRPAVTENLIKRFWHSGRRTWQTIPAPIGSMLCDWVRVIRRVEE